MALGGTVVERDPFGSRFWTFLELGSFCLGLGLDLGVNRNENVKNQKKTPEIRNVALSGGGGEAGVKEQCRRSLSKLAYLTPLADRAIQAPTTVPASFVLVSGPSVPMIASYIEGYTPYNAGL